ncbi:MAG: hypothetical protein FJ087_23375, partial [Deltaproteobacteria bacterium]|nr:hypothetical protein [Deltaproteobacteria bacterium]
TNLPGLTVGKHPYKFRTPGADLWFFDPANPDREDDGQGGFNSILTVPSACPGECVAGGKRCRDAAAAESCEAGRDGCRAWTAAPCAADTHCLLDRCETFPVIDPVARTATFVLPFEGSPAVRVLGSFTDPPWGADAALAMTQAGGNWTATSGALAAGTYQYKFRAEDGAGGTTWITDPNNPDKVDDTMGGFNSVFVIP